MNNEETQEIVILDTPKNASNPNPNLKEKDLSIIDNQRSINVLRYQKGKATKKGRSQYKKGLKNSLQCLVDSVYCSLEDGTELTGGDIIAMALFERATQSDKAAKLVATITGDLNESSNEEENYEGFIENVGIKF